MSYLENLLFNNIFILANYIILASFILLIIVLTIFIVIWLLSLLKTNKKLRFYIGLSIVIHLLFFASINAHIPIKYIKNNPMVISTIDDLEYHNITKLYSDKQNNTQIHNNPNNKKVDSKVNIPSNNKNNTVTNIAKLQNKKETPTKKQSIANNTLLNTKTNNTRLKTSKINQPYNKQSISSNIFENYETIEKPNINNNIPSNPDPKTFEEFKKLKGINDNTDIEILHRKGQELNLHSKKREHFVFKEQFNRESEQNYSLKSFDKFIHHQYISKLFYKVSTTWFYKYGQHPINAIFLESYNPGKMPVSVRFDITPKGKIQNFKFIFSGKPPEYRAVKSTFNKFIKEFNIKPPKDTHYENLTMTFLLSPKKYDPKHARTYLWGYTSIEGDTVYDKK